MQLKSGLTCDVAWYRYTTAGLVGKRSVIRRTELLADWGWASIVSNPTNDALSSRACRDQDIGCIIPCT